MKLYFEDQQTHGQFSIMKQESCFKGQGILNKYEDTTNTIVCNGQEEQQVVIDNISYCFPARSVLPLVANQHFTFERPESLVVWQFNREFYCIADHDAEVGCVGFLFYGIRHPFFIHLDEAELEGIHLIERLCIEDMEIRDKMQGEMLRTLLKRLIIKITRIAKRQTQSYREFTEEKLDLVRMFNLLLEANFRQQHEVKFYAAALNKSPKTLVNLFNLLQSPAPSKLIQSRLLIEAKRYLYYTEKTAKEIAWELGFSSPANFSRFFKIQTGDSISNFRSSGSYSLHNT